jgi:hypothetical protein
MKQSQQVLEWQNEARQSQQVRIGCVALRRIK